MFLLQWNLWVSQVLEVVIFFSLSVYLFYIFTFVVFNLIRRIKTPHKWQQTILPVHETGATFPIVIDLHNSFCLTESPV